MRCMVQAPLREQLADMILADKELHELCYKDRPNLWLDLPKYFSTIWCVPMCILVQTKDLLQLIAAGCMRAPSSPTN